MSNSRDWTTHLTVMQKSASQDGRRGAESFSSRRACPLISVTPLAHCRPSPSRSSADRQPTRRPGIQPGAGGPGEHRLGRPDSEMAVPNGNQIGPWDVSNPNVLTDVGQTYSNMNNVTMNFTYN